jgi:hypothetical protein
MFSQPTKCDMPNAVWTESLLRAGVYLWIEDPYDAI